MLRTSSSRPALILLLLILLTGCATPVAGISATPTSLPAPSQSAYAPTRPATPLQPTPLPATITPISPTATPQKPSLWISPDVPAAFRSQLRLPFSIRPAVDYDSADLRLEITAFQNSNLPHAAWVYALVAPFPTLTDEVSAADLKKAWYGWPTGSTGSVGSSDSADVFQKAPLYMTAETRAALSAQWGKPAAAHIALVDQNAILDKAWQNGQALAGPSFAIIPFDEIQPRWKVLRVAGQSPFDKTFNPFTYPLAISIRLNGSPAALHNLPAKIDLPTNRDPAKLTVLVMTGTTAISRHIGERMESKGLTYPGGGIRSWLVDADLTHISNEVSFYKDCPRPGPLRADMRFCSSPKYIELLKDVGTDIVELTGNHNLDWGYQPFLDTLEIYKTLGWKTYGGGAKLEDARKPLMITHNGNRLVFIGCSPSGPAAVWATDKTPGSAPCDFFKLEAQIRKLRADGYLPIVTFQAVETDLAKPAPAQGAPDFRRMARAGAVIVSGSQSHVPQTMTLVGDSFVHYGLGNLFFDQMTPPESRQEFIDRHVFYNGKYLGVDLLTALLEDYSRPRPMTTTERSDFLQKIFALCNWSEN